MSTANITTGSTHWTETSDRSRLPANPVVSVLMLAYNHGPYLAQAIDGVLMQQTDFPIELLIGEDCSSDDSREVALRYQDLNPSVIRVITAASNVGMHANHQRLFEASCGDYVAYCEGDDYWHSPDKLQLQVDLANLHSHIVLVHSDYDRRVGQHVRRDVYRQDGVSYDEVRDAFDDLFLDWRLITATCLYRAQVLRDFLSSEFANQGWPFLDLPMALYASLHGKVGYIGQSLATWRYAPGSATNADISAHARMMRAIGECHDLFAARLSYESARNQDWRCRHEKGTYGAAFLAGDLNGMAKSWQWLRDHDAGRPQMHYLLERTMVRLQFPLVWARFRHKLRRSRELRSESRTL